MHLIERYALSCGVKIGNPFIYPKFFPTVSQKFITFHGSSKQAKTYDYWQDVIDILLPVLQKSGIDIIQIGDKETKRISGCYYIAGQTSIGQVAYLVSKSHLHLGVDSFPVHFAGYYNKPIVALYCTSYTENSKPYWGDPAKQILIRPETNRKPSFSNVENPKSINGILPEKIAESVCKLLGLPFDYKYKTIFLGDQFNNMLDSVPNHVVNVQNLGTDSLILRMDFVFNEEIAAQQLSVCPCAIVTKAPLNPQFLIKFKPRIREIHYEIGENPEPNFVRFLQQLGIKFNLLSYLPIEKHNALKIDFMDFGFVHSFSKEPIDNLLELKKIGPIFYKSSKFTLSNRKIYPSKYAFLNDKPIESIGNHLCQIPENDDPEFWKEKIHFRLLQQKI